MKSRTQALLPLYQIAAGLSDTCTGLLLLAAPAWTLRLMHVTQSPAPAVFASFLGAFVLGVGLTYLWLALRYGQGLATTLEWESQWRCTGIIRGCVACFLFLELGSGRMEPAWSLVAFSDAALALLQAIGLHRGWLRSALGDSLG